MTVPPVLMLGDCLERMGDIADGSVDLVLCDPPYGTVEGIGDSDSISHGMKGRTGWDTALDPAAMYEQCNRVLRMNGALVLFSQEPYTSKLINEAHGNLPFSYRLVWVKDHFANALIAKKAPVSYYEDIAVFFKRHDMSGTHPVKPYARRICEFIGYTRAKLFAAIGNGAAQHFLEPDGPQFGLCTRETYARLCEIYRLAEQEWFKPFDELQEADTAFKRDFSRAFNLPPGQKYKSNVLTYRKDYDGFHPTQKPVALLEDLIRTYSNEGDTVLDFTMGSGSTGVAAAKTGRRFIGIEREAKYYEIAQRRISDALNAGPLFAAAE
jgi:DNA modification methylase